MKRMSFFLPRKKFFKKRTTIFLCLFLLLIASIILFVTQLITQQTAKTVFSLVGCFPLDNQTGISSLAQPTCNFSKNIDASQKDLGNYFHIAPFVSGTWHIEKDQQTVYFSPKNDQFIYNTVYTITIDKKFSSASHDHLKKDVSIAFKTKQNPQFLLSVQNKLLHAFSGQSPSIMLNQWTTTAASQQSPLTVSMYAATKNQLLNYFTYKKMPSQGEPFYLFEKTSQNTKIFSLLARVDPNTSGNGGRLSLPPIVTPGIYYVTVENQYGHDDFFLVVTDHIMQVYTDQKNYYVWTTDENGRNIPQAFSEFYSLENSPTLLFRTTANDQAVAVFSQAKKLVDVVISISGQNVAITGASEMVATNNFFIKLTANKNIYHYGEHAVVVAQSNFPVTNALIVTSVSPDTTHIVSVSNIPVNWNTWSFPIPIQKSYGKRVGVDVFTVYQQTVIRSHIDLAINAFSNQ